MIQLRPKYILLFIMIVLCATTGFSQETTAEINGFIHDASGSGLPGASIEAVHTPTGSRYATTSRKDGHYNLPNLRVGGPYTISANYVGYEAQHRDSINLLLGQAFVADFTLSPTSQALENVVVTTISTNKVFNNNRTGSQEVISRNQIERLPTVNRSLQDFTRLTPSANGLNFGGRNNLYNNVTVDGANFNNAFGLSSVLGGQTNSQPISLDAIEQIQVNISPFDVRQGNFAGTGLNTVTRSGTNTFKGTVYTYLKGPGTQGYKVGDITVPKQQFNYNLRGAAIGGPIIKNKLFFFVSGESERVTSPATSYVASSASVTPGPNVSLANADTLNALKDFLIEKYGYNPGEFQNYSYETFSDKLTAKLDLNINDKNTLTLKYNYLKSYREIAASNSGAPGGNRQPGTYSLPFSGSGYQINNNFNIVIAELNSRFGNHASNKLQVGYTALRDYRASLSGKDFPLVDILDGEGRTYTSFGYEPFTYNNLLNTDIIQLSDIFTLYRGAHEITLGTQNYYKEFKNGFAPNYAGTYRFNTLSDFYNSAINGVANSAQYQVQYSVLPGGEFPFAEIGAFELGLFVQDKWRINNAFTFTYGLRLDAPFFKDAFQVNPNVSELTFAGGKQYSTGQKPETNLLISPRVGFNWNVNGEKTTQIRGGIGLFAGPPPFVWISNQASNNGVQFGSIFSTSPYAFNPDITANKPSSVSENTSYNLVFTDKDFKYPQVMKASLGIDQRLPGNFVLTIEGNFNKDINSVYFQNVNLPSTGTTLAGGDPRFRFDSTRIYGSRTPTAANPNISSAILMTNSNKGYSYFVTAQLQKTIRNLYLNAAYTHSNSKSLNDGGSIAQSMWRDRLVSNSPNAEDLGYSTFRLPHRVVASASYRVQYAKRFATSIGLVFEGSPASVGSYVYNGDINNDGTGGNNDLIYIPRNQNDILLVPVNTGGGTVTDTRTPDEIWQQLNAYIAQDRYLRNNRGEVAMRNAVIFPWYKRFDMNITQDVFFTTGKENTKHTLRFSIDLVNAGNLFNKNWGTYKVFNTGGTFSSAILKYEGLAANNQPRFSFPYLDPTNKVPLTESFKDDASILSRWQMQFGVRYLFN